MRLGKFLAAAGVASRRAAEEIIRAGGVRVDGETVTDPARDVGDEHEVRVEGKPVRVGANERVVFALHKPAGVVSTARDPQGRPTVVELVPSLTRLYPVGRLDADTTGLILLTNDGALAHRLTHPSFEIEKTYVAVVGHPPVRERALRELRQGIELEDGRTAPARARTLAPDTVELVLHEGRKRQVRRMLEAVGHPVLRLARVRLGPLPLGDLPLGSHRRLTPSEVGHLRAAGAAARPDASASSATRARPRRRSPTPDGGHPAAER